MAAETVVQETGETVEDGRRLARRVAMLERALSDVGRCAAESLAEGGVTDWGEGADGWLYVKDTVDTALGTEDGDGR